MIKQQYEKLRQFYRGDFRHQLIITTIAFVALIVIGFAAGLIRPAIAENMVDHFAQMVAGLGLQEVDGSISAGLIFANNLRAMIVSICYGFLPFICLPALSLGINTVLVGLFGAYYINNGATLLTFLSSIIPHGIFEIPALILSLSCGLYLCNCVSDSIRLKAKGTIGDVVKQIIRVVAFHIFPLLLVAAFVEAYITPHIMNMFL